MRLVEKHIIRKSHRYWSEIDDLSFLSKNLYNAANYLCRQEFFSNRRSFSLPDLYHLTKNLPDYRALPTKVSKQIIKRLVSSWKGYFEAHKEWTRNPSKFLSEPRIPGYKHKTKGRNLVVYTHESVYKKPLKVGICHLSMSSIKVNTKVDNLIEVRLVPKANHYVVEIVYEKEEEQIKSNENVAGIDLGINNLIALNANILGFTPVLLNGRPLKSVNQFFNKTKARLQSKLPKDQKTSRRIAALTDYRNRYVDNYLHNTSRAIVKILKAFDVNALVIGKNDNWKQNINLGKKTNQSFTQIPHAKLIDQITYKCQLAGIKVVITEESYTSKTSALDLELPVKQTTYKGKRVKRGLFKTSNGTLLNADINGSTQIIRKIFPNAFANGIESVAVTPILVNPV